VDSDRFEDPVVEAHWLREQRVSVAAYLNSEKVAHGGIGDAPAWFVAPYLAIWPVTSLKDPSSIGWLVISGDVPTDYLSSAEVRVVREVVRAFSERWAHLAERMFRGDPHPTMRVGEHALAHELAPLLQARAELLESFANDDACWGEERAGEQKDSADEAG
jgi:hypothetical protein